MATYTLSAVLWSLQPSGMFCRSSLRWGSCGPRLGHLCFRMMEPVPGSGAVTMLPDVPAKPLISMQDPTFMVSFYVLLLLKARDEDFFEWGLDGEGGEGVR